MHLAGRVARHLRLSAAARGVPASPPFLILYVDSVCNMRCEHCYAWRRLNQRGDLTLEEITRLALSLGTVENLNLSGGEPLLRKDLADVCRVFVRGNGTRLVYVPTNGSLTRRTVAFAEAMLAEPDLDLLVLELSLDGTQEFHDRFRRSRNAFARAMATAEALAAIQARDARLRVHAVSTATAANLDEIRRLSAFLIERCPVIEHHNLAILRGDPRNPELRVPDAAAYAALYRDIRQMWAPREQGRFGSSVEPMLQWAKLRVLAESRQVVPCTAGRLTGVVYANGDVALCELLPPVGNLREAAWDAIWRSDAAETQRAAIHAGDCHCTTEVFLWPSIVYQPAQLLRAEVGAARL